MVTSQGTLELFLDALAAPVAVNSFVFLADGTTSTAWSFIASFPVSSFKAAIRPGAARVDPGYRFPDELPKPGRYELGSLAMANSGPIPTAHSFSSFPVPTGCGYLRCTRTSAKS